jgi:uncharacterized tellurite resistance protein B-like protein
VSLEHFVAVGTVISSLAGRFVGYPDQIRLVLKTRTVTNVSVSLYAIGFVSCLLWTWHGWLMADWVILLTQGVAGVAATGSMLFLLWRYRPQAIADETLMAILVHLVALDGQMHPDERAEVARLADGWKLKPDWALAERVMSVSERHTEAVAALRRYLAMRPPVARLRELKDVIWLLVQADGVVTEHERALMRDLYTLLESSSPQLESLEDMDFRVLLVHHEEPLPPSFEYSEVAGKRVAASVAGHTELVARQHAAELRGPGMAAVVVKERELEVRAASGPL